MAKAELKRFFEQVSNDKRLRKHLERARGRSEFLEESVAIGRKLDLLFTTRELDRELANALESIDAGKGLSDFGPLQAWTDGCGGSVCTLTNWTNTYSGCGSAAEVRKKAGIR